VKAAVSGLLAGLLVAAIWFALFSGTNAVRREPAAAPVTVPAARIESALPPARNEPAGVEAQTPPVHLAARSQPPTLMPGFIAAPPARADAAETASERNRRFLDAVNSRVRASR